MSRIKVLGLMRGHGSTLKETSRRGGPVVNWPAHYL